MSPLNAQSMFEKSIGAPQWSFTQKEKEDYLLAGLKQLTAFHRSNCESYADILSSLWPVSEAQALEQLPYLPVSLFKTHWLSSIPKDELRMVMTSSGTTGSAVSQIAIDAQTASRQSKALNASILSVVSKNRPPMLIADTKAVIKDPKLLSARGAGVLGMMRFGRKHCFILDDDLKISEEALHKFLSDHDGKDIIMFGFTFMAWKYLYQAIQDAQYDLSNCTLIHSGGWKKLQSEAVSPSEFRELFRKRCNLTKIYNFYGMVEQMGSIFLEGEDGFLYPPNCTDIIIRDPSTFEPLPHGETGIIQVLSLIPSAYPGHSLLTEDLGVIEHVDKGVGGRLGKALRVVGRLPKVELRGCSDVFAKSNA